MHRSKRPTAGRYLTAALLLAAAGSPAATFTVTNTSDAGAGSLRQAISDANGSAGADVIEFAIGSVGSQQVISLASALPGIAAGGLLIDGWSQGGPGYKGAPLVEFDFASANASPGLSIQQPNTTVRGVAITGVNFSGNGVGIAVFNNGSSTWIYGCYIGVGIDGTAKGNQGRGIMIGGVNSANCIIGSNGDSIDDDAERNVISANGVTGIYLYTDATATIDNNFVGTNPAGTAALGTQQYGIYLSDVSGNSVSRNVASGNTHSGIILNGCTGPGNIIISNKLGTDATGTAAIPNGNRGLWNYASANTIIGMPTRGNILSGNAFYGIGISVGSTAVSVRSNLIGVAADGTTPLGNGWDGIIFGLADQTSVGGSAFADRNTIAYNGRFGVRLNVEAGVGNTLWNNYIHSNEALDVDIANPSGPNANDPLDADTGANEGANFPVILSAAPGATSVSVRLDGAPSTNYTVALYSSDAADGTGRGEAKSIVDINPAVTDASGVATITFLTAPLAAGTYLCAMATDAAGNSSEFGPAFHVTTPATMQGLDRIDANPTNLDTVAYNASFSAPVRGVSPASFDVTANGLTGAGVASVENPLGNALQTDGNGQFADIPDGVYFSGDFTIEAWVHPTELDNYTRICDFGNGAAADNVFMCLSESVNGHPFIGYYRGAGYYRGVAGPNQLPVDRWTHLAATLSGTTLTLYVDGQPVGSTNAPLPPNNILRTSNFLARSNWGPVQDPDAAMKIDNFCVWNVARTPGQILASASPDASLPAPQPGLLIAYDFEQLQDLGANADGADDIEDKSGNGLHADTDLSPAIVPSDVPRTDWTVNVSTGTGDGDVALWLADNDSITDMTPNPVGGPGSQIFVGQTYLVDKTAPTSLASADPTQAGPDITIASTSADTGGAGLAVVALQVKTPVSLNFGNSGLTPDGSGTFTYIPAMDGRYEFRTITMDAAGNVETSPTTIAVLSNTVENSTFQHFVFADGTYLFPMTDDNDIAITITGATPGGTLSVMRTIPNTVAPSGLDAARLADESLEILGSGLGSFTAGLTWTLESSSVSGLTGAIENIYQFDGGILTGTYPVTPSGNTLTISGLTGFSEWYAGNNASSVGEWETLD